jgi:hypothetical protein
MGEVRGSTLVAYPFLQQQKQLDKLWRRCQSVFLEYIQYIWYLDAEKVLIANR